MLTARERQVLSVLDDRLASERDARVFRPLGIGTGDGPDDAPAMLRSLEERGFVEMAYAGPTRVYGLTWRGREVVAELEGEEPAS